LRRAVRGEEDVDAGDAVDVGIDDADGIDVDTYVLANVVDCRGGEDDGDDDDMLDFGWQQ
jgi:hypothetical protein